MLKFNGYNHNDYNNDKKNEQCYNLLMSYTAIYTAGISNVYQH